MGNCPPCGNKGGGRLRKLKKELARNPSTFKEIGPSHRKLQLGLEEFLEEYGELSLLAVELDKRNVHYVKFEDLPKNVGKKILQMTLQRKCCPSIILKIPVDCYSHVELVSAIKLGCTAACPLLAVKKELDPATVFDLVKSAPAILNTQRYKKYAENRKYLEAALKASQPQRPGLKKFPEKFKNDRELVHLAVEYNAMWLQDFQNFADNRPIVMTAVERCGFALEFASDRLCKDRAVVETAIKNDGRALKFALGDDLRRDYDLVNQAIIHSKGYAIADAHDSLRSNPNLVRTSLSLDGRNLQFLLPPMNCRSSIVKYAVANNPWTVEHLSENMNESLALEVILLAVQREWRVAQFIPKKFRKYFEKISLCAMRGWKVGKLFPGKLRMVVASSLYKRRPTSPDGKSLTRRLPVYILQWIFEFLHERILTPEAWRVLRPGVGLIKGPLNPGILLSRAIELDGMALSIACLKKLDHETAWKAVTHHASAIQWVPGRIVAADHFSFLIRFVRVDPGNFVWVRKTDLFEPDSSGGGTANDHPLHYETIIKLAVPNKEWAERWLDPEFRGAISVGSRDLVGDWLHEAGRSNLWNKAWRRCFAKRCVQYLGGKAENIIKAHTGKRGPLLLP